MWIAFFNMYLTNMLAWVIYSYNFRTWEAEAGRFLWIQGQSGTQDEFRASQNFLHSGAFSVLGFVLFCFCFWQWSIGCFYVHDGSHSSSFSCQNLRNIWCCWGLFVASGHEDALCICVCCILGIVLGFACVSGSFIMKK